jgi:hypothetical protein
MTKSLSESAAEILKASMNAGKEPMQTLQAGEKEDLGGSTHEKPEGDEIGKIVANDAKEAPKPGQVSNEGEKTAPKPAGVGGMKGDVKPVMPMGGDKPVTGIKEEEEVSVDVDAALAESNDSEQDEDEDEDEAKKIMMKDMVKKHSKSMKEDVDALFNGESLSEEFRVKATTIFEAAVNSRVESIIEDVVAENNTILEEAIEEIKTEMSTQVDEYLNYVVEEWVNENKVAIETGLRAEIVEDFINGLKNLFAEHYIEIPDEKVDVAEELAAKVVGLEEAMAAAAAEKAALVEELNSAKKNEAIRKICEDLTETQIAKMISLAEGVEFTTEGEFNNKLAVIRENYFPTKKVTSEVKALQETAVEEPEVVEVSGMMKHYVQAITKTAAKA